MLSSRYLTENDLGDFGFKAIGSDVQISADARVYGAGNISLGSHIRIDDFCTLVAAQGSIMVGDYVSIMRGCHLSGVNGIELEPFAHLAGNVLVYSASDDLSGHSLTTSTVPR